MLTLEGVNVHYGKIHVLRDVALRVDAGEVVGLVGPNAAGKTTTLRTVIGLKSRTSGTIRLADQPIGELSTPERVRLGAVLVPEGRQVFTRYTVRENLGDGRLSSRRSQAYRTRYRGNLFAVPAPVGAAGATGGTDVGRRAADAGDRPRA